MARIAVIHGGMGYTRDVSLTGAHHVAAAVRHLGHDVIELDADGSWSEPVRNVDAVLPLLFGLEGEEGNLTAVCEAVGLPYLGSDPATCRLCGDKTMMKQRLAGAKVATPDAYTMSAEAVRRYAGLDALRIAADRLGYPVIVKPVVQSQGVGVHRVDSGEDLAVAVRAAFAHGDEVMVERYVEGTEIAVCLLGPELAPLPLVEIRLTGGLFDIQTRSHPTGGGVEYVIPAEIDEATADAVRDVAAAAAAAVGVRDLARVDIRLGPDGPQVLDVTPCPGLSETSAISQAAAADGISYEELIGQLVTLVLRRSGRAARPGRATRR